MTNGKSDAPLSRTIIAHYYCRDLFRGRAIDYFAIAVDYFPAVRRLFPDRPVDGFKKNNRLGIFLHLGLGAGRAQFLRQPRTGLG